MSNYKCGGCGGEKFTQVSSVHIYQGIDLESGDSAPVGTVDQVNGPEVGWETEAVTDIRCDSCYESVSPVLIDGDLVHPGV